jgi:hypothetical protein
MSRSTPLCNGGGGVREQFNQNTPFIDGSQVYGSSTGDLPRFRNGNTGFMRTSTFVSNARRKLHSYYCVVTEQSYLPTIGSRQSICVWRLARLDVSRSDRIPHVVHP